MKKLTTNFKLVGLSKPRSFTLYTAKDEIFWAKSNMPYERFDALFEYCKGNWKDKKLAEVEHDGLNEEGYPKNPVVINIVEPD